MQRYMSGLPQLGGGTFLTWTGIGTDLVFNRGIGVPGDPTYVLLSSVEGRGTLRAAFAAQIEVARKWGTGVILEAPVWDAHRDRGAVLGFDTQLLVRRNTEAIALMCELRDATPDLTVVVSACIGPRGDAFVPDTVMSVEQSRSYHAEQLGWVAATNADMASFYTIGHADEAAGFVLAAFDAGLPCVVSFTVETDGRLPTGASLATAIAEVDAVTNSYASYFMINCAHPDHFADDLSDEPWMGRLKGIVANASRCSHAELDEADELDDGDPIELGRQLSKIRNRFPQINVLGGCCGTDMRHISRIAEGV